MIIKTVNDDIFNTDSKNIVFGTNTEGINNFGFSGQVGEYYWNELKNIGTHKLGEVLTKEINGIKFHAIVCHSLNEGWPVNQYEIIKNALDKIECDEMSAVAIGTGIGGILGGAEFEEILTAMHDSSKNIILYGDFRMKDILEVVYENEKVKKLI